MNSEKWEVTLLDEDDNILVVLNFDSSAQARTIANNYITAGRTFKIKYIPYKGE